VWLVFSLVCAVDLVTCSYLVEFIFLAVAGFVLHGFDCLSGAVFIFWSGLFSAQDPSPRFFFAQAPDLSCDFIFLLDVRFAS
jgi:hypothetical protein